MQIALILITFCDKRSHFTWYHVRLLKKTISYFSLQSLPAPVKRRLKALKKLQLEATKIEAKFYEEIHALECKYHELYSPLYTKRTKITKGEFSSRFNICLLYCFYDECLLGSNSDTSYEGNFHDSNLGLMLIFKAGVLSYQSKTEFQSCFDISGDYEPNDEECEWPSDSEDEDDDDEDGENDKDEKEKKKKEKEVRLLGGHT